MLRWLLSSRVLSWGFLLVTALALDVIGGLQQWQQLLCDPLAATRSPHCQSVPPEQAVFQLSQAEAKVLHSLGLSPTVYAVFLLSAEALFTISFVLVSWVVLRRGVGFWTWVFSVTFMTFGTSVSGLVQPIKVFGAPGYLYWPAYAYETLATIGCLLAVYLIPTGRFIPRWTAFFALLWTGCCLCWFSAPDAPLNVIHFETFVRWLPYSLLFAVSFFVVGLVARGWYYWRTVDSLERQQSRAVFVNLVPAVVCGSLFYVRSLPAMQAARPELSLLFKLWSEAVAVPALALAPVAICTRVLGYPLRIWRFNVATLLERFVVKYLGALFVLWLAIFGVCSSLIPLIFHGSNVNPIVIVWIAVVVAPLLLWRLWPYWNAMSESLLRSKPLDTSRLRQLANDVNRIMDLSRLARILAQRVAQVMDCEHAVVYLRGGDARFEAVAAANRGLKTLPALAISERDVSTLEAGEPLRRQGDPIFTLILPLIGLRTRDRNPLEGLLILGPYRSHEPYGREDREALQALAREAGLAISTVQLHDVFRAQEARLKTPHGRAEVLTETLLADPASALTVVHRLADEAARDAEAHAVLANLPPALQELHADEALVDLARGFSYLVADASAAEVKLGLHLLAGGALAAAPGWAGGRQAIAFYRICQAALEAASVSDVAQLVPDMETMVDADEMGKRSESGSHEAGPQSQGTLTARAQALPKPLARRGGQPPVSYAQAVGLLRAVASGLDAALTAEAVEEQEEALAEVLHEIERLERGLRAVRSAPERLIIRRIGEHWRAVCVEALDDVQGSASLVVTLLTRQVIATADVPLVLEIANHGRRPANTVTAELLAGKEQAYEVVDGSARVTESLEPGWPVQLSFVVRPCGGEPFIPRFLVRYKDEHGRERLLSHQAPVEMLAPPPAFAPFDNPYVVGRSLAPESPLFVGREPLIRSLVEALRRPGVVVLSGEHRMGKTSLLRQLPVRLKQTYAAALVDCQGLLDPGLPSFFYNVSCEIALALRLPRPSREMFHDHPGFAFEREVLPEALRAIGERCLLLMFDEYEALQRQAERGKLDADIFPYLRHLMQHQEQVAFIFAGTHRLQELKAQYWSSFFNVGLHRRVGLLEEAEAQELITRPVGPHLIFEDLALRRMLRLTAGHPYFLQLLCQTLVERALEEERTYVAASHVRAALREAVQAGVTHLDSLWKERTHSERLLLYALSQLAPLNGRATEAAILAFWAERGVHIGQPQVSAALDRLCLADVVAAADAGTAMPGQRAVQWKVQLIGYWVQQEQALNQLLGEATESERDAHDD